MINELMQFLGKIVGMCSRHNLPIGLALSNLVWRPLVHSSVLLSHLESVDSLTVSHIKDIEQKATELSSAGSTAVPPEWADITFTTHLSDGSRVNLLPRGDEIQLSLDNWQDYVTLLTRQKLRESVVMLRMFRDGLAAVVPVELFPLFTATELSQLISGSQEVNIALLK